MPNLRSIDLEPGAVVAVVAECTLARVVPSTTARLEWLDIRLDPLELRGGARFEELLPAWTRIDAVGWVVARTRYLPRCWSRC